jgi:hypothetical protein
MFCEVAWHHTRNHADRMFLAKIKTMKTEAKYKKFQRQAINGIVGQSEHMALGGGNKSTDAT